MGRKYHLYATWHVTCETCNEDITEQPTYTRQDAEEQKQIHEQWHQTDKLRKP